VSTFKYLEPHAYRVSGYCESSTQEHDHSLQHLDDANLGYAAGLAFRILGQLLSPGMISDSSDFTGLGL